MRDELCWQRAARVIGIYQRVTEQSDEYNARERNSHSHCTCHGISKCIRAQAKQKFFYHSSNGTRGCSCLAAGFPPHGNVETQSPFILCSFTLLVTSDRDKREKAFLLPETLGPGVVDITIHSPSIIENPSASHSWL